MNNDNEIHVEDMTLRDFFASQIAGHVYANMSEHFEKPAMSDRVAETAYLVAEEMLIERKFTNEDRKPRIEKRIEEAKKRKQIAKEHEFNR